MSNTLFERPIVIYSNYCIHSQNFLKLLIKNPDLYDAFIRMNIDVNPETKQRPQIFYKIQEELNQKIVKVPTIIVMDNEGLLVLSDKDAFKWLELQTAPLKEELSPFNQNEMNSFSDGYAKYGSTDLNDATEQNFKFFKTVNGQTILQGESFKCGPIKGPDSFKEQVSDQSINSEQVYKKLESERKNVNFTADTNQARQTRKPIDFTGDQFNSSKQKDLDSRLQQLMMDRKAL